MPKSLVVQLRSSSFRTACKNPKEVSRNSFCYNKEEPTWKPPQMMSKSSSSNVHSFVAHSTLSVAYIVSRPP
jgi:hypothetical protein